MCSHSYFVGSSAGVDSKYCDEYVCVRLSVCSRGYLRNHTRDLYQIFSACTLLGPRHSGVVAIPYVLPVLWMTSSSCLFCYNGPYTKD